MTTFALYFRSDYTKKEWIRLSHYFTDLHKAIDLAKMRADEMPSSEVAIFAVHSNGDINFSRPYRLYNRRPATGPIVGLGGLINSLESDWF